MQRVLLLFCISSLAITHGFISSTNDNATFYDLEYGEEEEYDGYDAECPRCDVTHCPIINEPCTTGPDGCMCCQMCIRGFNESCWDSASMCGDGLQCTKREDDYICTAISSEITNGQLDCTNAICPQTICPADSQLVMESLKEGSCCQAKNCVCNACPTEAASEYVRNNCVLKRGTGQPRSCCDQWECSEEPVKLMTTIPPLDCKFEDRIYYNGDVWESGYSGNCEECTCVNGQYYCHTPHCDPSNVLKCPQSLRLIRRGKCCLECTGCEDPWTKQIVSLNETYVANNDPCRECECQQNGEPHCWQPFCSVQCRNPIDVPGQCCKRCPDTDDTSDPVVSTTHGHSIVCRDLSQCERRCVNGYKTKPDGCPSCECHDRSQTDNPMMCELLLVSHCSKRCINGYVQSDNGCYKCQCSACPLLSNTCSKSCVYGFELNDDNCEICKCRSAVSQISPFPISKSDCVDGGVNHKFGDVWHNRCRRCTCKSGGRYFCSVLECPILNCQNPVYSKDDCCPYCKVEPVVLPDAVQCSSDNLRKVEGESFQLDRCTTCTCQMNQILCEVMHCNTTACNNPTIPEGSCCPVCSDFPQFTHKEWLLIPAKPVCEFGRKRALLLETFDIDACTSARCHYNLSISAPSVLLYHQTCTSCRRPVHIEAKCCPKCLPEKSYSVCTTSDGDQYVNGEVWNESECKQCNCDKGISKCTHNSQCKHIKEIATPPFETFKPNQTGFFGRVDQLHIILTVSCLVLLLVLFVFIIFACYHFRRHLKFFAGGAVIRRCSSVKHTNMTTQTNNRYSIASSPSKVGDKELRQSLIKVNNFNQNQTIPLTKSEKYNSWHTNENNFLLT